MKTTTGAITATGTANGVIHTLGTNGPAVAANVGVSGTFTSAVVQVDTKLQGGSIYYPAVMIDRKSGVKSSGTASPTDSTATSWLVDTRGCSHLRVSVASGTPTDVDVEIVSGQKSDFDGPLQFNTISYAAASTFSAGISFDGATTINVISIPDNLADALSISEAGNEYLTFVTTNGSERIDAFKKIRFADSAKLAFGDADDITIAWDGTDLDVLQAAANSSIKFGIDGAGIDIVLYGDTASASVTWDQSADSLILAGVAKIKLQTIAAATGTAIPVTHSGSFPITQNGAETNTLAIPTYLGQTLTIFVDTDTTGARVITSAQRINQAGNTIITLTEVGDCIKLEAITIGGALRWQVISNDGAVLS